MIIIIYACLAELFLQSVEQDISVTRVRNSVSVRTVPRVTISQGSVSVNQAGWDDTVRKVMAGYFIVV